MNVLHPPFVHFVIALPLAALFSQLTYLGTGNITYSKAAIRIMAFALLTSFFAVFSGIIDAQEVMRSHHILESGLSVLSAHKTFGFVVVAILLITTVVKWFAISKGSLSLEKFSVVLIILTIATSLYQGKQGGSLVYEYGAGVSKQAIEGRSMQKNK